MQGAKVHTIVLFGELQMKIISNVEFQFNFLFLGSCGTLDFLFGIETLDLNASNKGRASDVYRFFSQKTV